jgi:uncharacterized protein (DUF927 family)
MAEYLRMAPERNCGHAARDFLLHLTKEDMSTLPAEIAKARAEFIAEHCPVGADGQVRRACGRFALVGIAGELASKHGITGWEMGAAEAAAARLFREWVEGRGGIGAAETREGLLQVRAFLEQHGESRFAPAWDRTLLRVEADGTETESVKTDRPTVNRAGFRRVTDEGTTYYVLPEVWRREVCKGREAQDVAEAMVERGWMLPGDGRNATRKPHIPGEKSSMRVYVITPTFMSADS